MNSWRARLVAAAALVVFAIGLNSVFSNLRQHAPAAPKPSPSSIASQSPPVAHSNLTISGAMTATSRPDRGSTCGYRAVNSRPAPSPPPGPAGRLLFGSDAMPVGSKVDARGLGPEQPVVRVGIAINLSGNRVGTYDAVSPLVEYWRTPLQVSVSPSEAAGIGEFWRAVSGRVTVSHTEHLGESGAYGFASGSVEGDLVNEISGASPIHVSGTWSCVIQPEANGP